MGQILHTDAVVGGLSWRVPVVITTARLFQMLIIKVDFLLVLLVLSLFAVQLVRC